MHMYVPKTLVALIVAAALAPVDSASAQALVQGGGASMPASLYKGAADNILPAEFSYVVLGSGNGKRAFLNNEPALLQTTGTVHYAGSDAVLTSTELAAYNSTYNSYGSGNAYGPLIQIPVALAPIIVPFNKPGGVLDLTVSQLCGVFSGRITRWDQLPAGGRTGQITVVYRAESSGSSEILTRFLTAACQTSDVSGTTLKSSGWGLVPSFSVQPTFANLFVGNTVPSNFMAAPGPGDVALYNAVLVGDGRIGYTGPDVVANLSDATKVATVKGYSPAEVSLQATIETVSPPTGAAANDPANWVPVFGNPSVGYPIVGLTNLIIGQCYQNRMVGNSLRRFLLTHYGSAQVGGVEQGRNDVAVRSHGFYPLPTSWRDAIRTRFALAGNAAGLNNPAVCNGIGRPL
ncbi:alkaline phosphatase [Stenotrophomonas maltophilia]|nr:substrate-binding domain-containing protein [Stenotrophomonas maltophilia]MBA0434573.1 alkaline phosphatase [Stenotrophomonas maltophilia]